MKPSLLVSDDLLDVIHPKYLNYFKLLCKSRIYLCFAVQNIWPQIKIYF